MTAIIIPVGENQSEASIGNVMDHITHLEENERVFWNFSPGGSKSNNVTQWKHPNIHTGYFYISKTQTIDYEFEIERVDLIREVDINNTSIKKWIPHWRNKFFDKTTKEYDKNGYAILINNINPLTPPNHKTDFVLESSGNSPKMIQNPIFVEDL